MMGKIYPKSSPFFPLTGSERKQAVSGYPETLFPVANLKTH
jgi:hypothetical protein